MAQGSMNPHTFWTVWGGQLVSQLGTSMTGFALTIYVYQDTGSITSLAVMLLAMALPGLLLGPTAGVVCDRFDRRLVMLVSDSIAAVGTLALAALYVMGHLTYGLVVGVEIVMSAASAFQDPAYRAAIPTLVPKAQLGRANGLIQLAPAVGTLVAPALAGAALLIFGLGAVLAADFISFLVAAATLSMVRFPDVSIERTERSVWSEFKEGLAYLRDRRGLLGLLGLYMFLNLVMTLSNVLWIPTFLAFANEAELGGVMSAAGVSMVIGSIVMSAWGGPRRRVRGLLITMMFAGCGVVIAGLRPSLVYAVVGTSLLLGLIPIINGTSQTLWQTKVEPSIQGRVFSARRMVAQFATPVAYLAAGPLADGIFEPLLAPDGRLATSVGTVWGVGAGRGSGFLISLAGAAVILLTAAAWSVPGIRNLESDIPDALSDSLPDVAADAQVAPA